MWSKRHEQRVSDEVLKLKKQWFSTRWICNYLLEKYWYVIATSTVWEMVQRLMATDLDRLNSDTDEPKRYDIEENNYVFYKKRVDWSWITDRYEIPIFFVDDIFKHYSRYGKDRTQQQCIDQFKVKPWVWNLLKTRLLLTKFSNILSPVSLEKLEKKWEAEVDKIIYEATYENIQDKHKEKFKTTYDTIFKKEWKEAMRVLANVDSFCEHLQQYIAWYKPKNYQFRSLPKNNSKNAIYAMADMHLWMKSTDDILKRLEIMTNDIINDQAENIHLINLGDLAETLVEWGMHSWQVEDMDWIYGFDLMMFVVENFENMLVNIRKHKRVSFTGIGWNHDRLLQQHNQDGRRMWALAIYELVKRWLANTDIDITYFHEKINSRDIGWLHIITHHWDDGFSNKKPEDILWKHWIPNKQNIIIHWDKHHWTMKEAKDAMMIGTPALANRGTYTKMIDAWSECGYVRIQENTYGTFNILLSRLP